MRWLVCASLLAALSGCHAFYLDVDGRISQRAAAPMDVVPAQSLDKTDQQAKNLQPPVVIDIGTDKADKKENQMMRRLEFKETILNLKIPDIKMPAPKLPDKEYEAALRKQFPPLPAIPALPAALPGPDDHPLTLGDLQQIALRTNPKIRQAHLQIDATRGSALQAGLYPNPNIGYEGTAIGQGNQDGQRSPGQQGGFVEQTVVTMGKKTLAREAALRDVQIAEQSLRQTEADVQTQVRAGYFAVLSARENYRVTRGLTELTDELYAVMLAQMRVGEMAGYEPMTIRVLAMKSRGDLTVAQNRYISAWRQLAAALGTPQMPLTEVAGRIDMPAPHFDHDQVLAYVLANHSDVISAQLGVERGRLQVRLAEVQPYPDLTLHAGFQKDYTAPPFSSIANVSVSVPFPLFDRNQGNIQAARSLLRKAVEDTQRVRNDLTARTAEVFEHYDNNRKLIDIYRKDMLPNQVQAFRAALARHAVVGNIPYNDVISSQQSLVGLISTYLGVLNDQWTSVIDIANLLQTRDLFQTHEVEEMATIPDVYELYRGRLHHAH